MQETIHKTQAGGNQKGRGKGKRKWKAIIESGEEPLLWWTPEEEYTFAMTWCRTLKNPIVGYDMWRVGF